MHHHGAGLRRILAADAVAADAQQELLHWLAHDYTQADLTAADRAILDYVSKLTRTPAAISAADVDALRTHGLTDRAVHDVCVIAAYFAFVNRIADGLGVELE